MGFAWHKLIPRHPSVPSVCPPPCTDTGTYTETIDSICAPALPSGAIPCAIFDPEWQYGGANCITPILVGGTRTNPGGPIELRLNTILGCTAPNDIDIQGDSNSGICYMGGVPHRQFYYYRTPNSPSSTPTQISSARLCLKYNPYTIPDRLMVISGRNRYKYGGWDVDPTCPAPGQPGGAPGFWDYSGGTGIKQAETLSLGRAWPLPNSVLNLPLFGADTSENPPTPPRQCSDGSCIDQSCFGVRANSATGHYLPSNQGNLKGYYSFQCFNPQGFINNDPLPPCSIWSLVQAIWYQVRSVYNTEEDAQSDKPNTWSAISTLFSTDPSGTTTQKSNVVVQLDALISVLASEGTGLSVVFPNVFLWDKDAFIAASTNEDKWKHIYIVGNANVIFDTQCMVGSATQSDRYGFVIYLDEVSHDPTYGSTGNARLVGFFGCNPTNGSNPSSEAYMELNTMFCSLLPDPKTGDPTQPCEACSHEGLGWTTGNKCYFFGYEDDCNFNWQTWVDGSGGGGGGPG